MAQTSIASGSNGALLPQGTINVVSTANFPSSGTLLIYSTASCQILAASDNVSLPTSNIVVNTLTYFATAGRIVITTNPNSYPQIVNYTGTTNSPQPTFTGCTGGTGILKVNGYVYQDAFVINYTGKTSTSFTGCTSSDIGTLLTGYTVYESTNSSAIDINQTIKKDIVTEDPSLIENSTYDNALPTYYKIRGLYLPSGLYETFISVGIITNINPTNNHALTDTSIVASWIGERITANVTSS